MVMINGEEVSTEEFDRRLYKLYHSHEEASTIQEQSSKAERRHVIKIPIKRQHVNNDVVVTSSSSLASSSINNNKEDETVLVSVLAKSSSSSDDTVLVQKQPQEKQRRLNFAEEVRYKQKLETTKKKLGQQYQLAREAKEKRQIRVILDLHDLPPLPSDSSILSGKNKRKRSHGRMNIPTATRNNNRLLRV